MLFYPFKAEVGIGYPPELGTSRVVVLAVSRVRVGLQVSVIANVA